MRLPTLAVLSLALSRCAQAQSATELISELPSCALNCIFQYLPDSSCSVTDIPCICSGAQLWANVTACVEPKCTVKESLTAKRIAAEACHTPVRDRHQIMAITTPTLAGIGLLLVIARVIARKHLAPDILGWDDSLIILAWLFGFPLSVIQFELGRHGLGRDIWFVSFHDITQTLKLFYLAEVFYLMSTVLTKLSILFFYLRVFSNVTFRRIVWVTMALCIAFTVSILFPLIFQCRPVSYAWTRWDGEHIGKCIDISAGVWSHAAINMALDVLVLVLPLPLLYKLQLTYSVINKVHIFIMFSFGLIVTIISALRLQTLVVFINSRNVTYDFLGPALWSGLETFIGIICACLPAAKVFFFRIAPKWMGLSSIGTSRNSPTPAPKQSWGVSSRASNTYRLSKPPQRVSATISAISDESNFLPLQGTTELEPKRYSWVVAGKAGLPLQSFSTPRG